MRDSWLRALQPSPHASTLQGSPHTARIPAQKAPLCLSHTSYSTLQLSLDFHTFECRDALVRSLAWSPLGSTPQGGCMLAVVTSDNRVRRGEGLEQG